MIRLTPTEPTTPEWKKWRNDAKAGHKDLHTQLRRHGTFDVKPSLYTRMREELFQLYHRKCAYCESPLRVSDSDQLDHFRPKNKVHDARNRPVLHTGYYWLAYEWTNLLPSCGSCNQRKGSLFPVLPGSSHARRPGKESSEKPIFIHPVREEPADHLEYVPATGFLKSKTPRGKSCIDLLNLNRSGLIEERREAYSAYVGLVRDLLHAVKEAEALPARKLDELKATLQGATKYSLVGRSALKQCESAIQEVFRTTKASQRPTSTPPPRRRRSRSAA